MTNTACKFIWQKNRLISAAVASIIFTISGPGTVAIAADLEAGKKSYERNCQACHRPNGSGMRGAFPPLAGNSNLNAEPIRAVNSIIKGVSGPLEVDGVRYNAKMPAMAHLSDREIANISTYILQSWGNTGPTISEEQVKAIREGSDNLEQ